MAVTKYYFLDTNGILKLSTDIFTNVNTRIGERILADHVVDAYYTQDKKALSAKAVLALIGKSSDTASASGTLYARIKQNASDISTNASDISDLNTSVGTSSDSASASGSVYARIAQNATDIGTLNTSVGTTSDTASATGSVYARIAATKAVADQAATDIGTSSDAASATGSVYARIAATKAVADGAATAIGASTDSADASGSLYARIAAVNAEISSLTHLTYQVVTGDIAVQVPPAQAKSDVLYLQHDEPSLAVNNAGYLIDSNGDPASYNGYYGWVDPATGTIYKADNTTSHTSTVLAANDPLLAENGPVARVEDTTYNLYVATNITSSSVDWLCVGDTEIALSNYWNKTDADVAALQAMILEAIPDATITTQVTAAFNATTPSLT